MYKIANVLASCLLKASLLEYIYHQSLQSQDNELWISTAERVRRVKKKSHSYVVNEQLLHISIHS